MENLQSWFEMQDVKKNILGNGEWIPLWAYVVSEKGCSESALYEEEIYRIRTLLTAPACKEFFFSRWFDLDTDSVYATRWGDVYCRPTSYYDTIVGNKPREIGEYAVFRYDLTRGQTSELMISQDMLAALKLTPQNDSYISSLYAGLDVIRKVVNENGLCIRIEIRTECLKEYLGVRGMGLYIEEFRHRQKHTQKDNMVEWNGSPLVENMQTRDNSVKYEWKGWMFIHRNKLSWSDIQSMGKPLELPQFYRIEGQLWKQYWIKPEVGIRNNIIL